MVVPQVGMRNISEMSRVRNQRLIAFACAMHESPFVEDLLDMGLLLHFD